MELWPRVAVLGTALSTVLAPAARSAALPIVTDGYGDDWTVAPLHADPAGDAGGSGVDFRNLWVAEDDDWLFIRFDTTIEIPLQETTNLALYLDTDANTATGVQVAGIGAELRWRFGLREGTFYGNPPPDPVEWENIEIHIGPSTTATEFEVAIGRHVLPDGQTPLFTGDDVHVVVRDETNGDEIPDTGTLATYTFTNEGLSADAIDLARDEPDHLRIVTMNVLFDSPWDTGQDERYDRIFSAIDPDVICFQEIYNHTGSQTRTLVEGWLPSGPGEFWFASSVNDRITVTRYPFEAGMLWNVGGNLAGVLNTDADLGMDLLLINCHLPCCEDDAGRQAQADEIAAFIGDAITPGGDVDLAEGTGIVVTGDMNFVGDGQQLRTLLTGDIVDEGTWGPDVVPDWDGSDLLDLVSTHTEVRVPYTWRNDASSFLPSRIDFHIVSDSVVGVGNHYLLYTPSMSQAALDAHGLLADDSPLASDHLPHVVDVFDRLAVSVGPVSPARPGDLVVHPNPMRAGATIFATLDPGTRFEASVYDAGGRLVRRLGPQSALPAHAGWYWDGRDDLGADVASGVYFVRISGGSGDGAVRATARITRLR